MHSVRRFHGSRGLSVTGSGLVLLRPLMQKLQFAGRAWSHCSSAQLRSTACVEHAPGHFRSHGRVAAKPLLINAKGIDCYAGQHRQSIQKLKHLAVLTIITHHHAAGNSSQIAPQLTGEDTFHQENGCRHCHSVKPPRMSMIGWLQRRSTTTRQINGVNQ